MTTDKERAEVYRELAAELPTEAYWSRPMLTRKADELDPPKPQWADGTIAVVTYDKGDDYARAVYARRSNGKWREADSAWFCFDDQVTSVTPLRVLGDDEIAVKRFEVDYMGPRESADRATNLGHGSNVTRAVRQVLRGYADALDAEAGEQS